MSAPHESDETEWYEEKIRPHEGMLRAWLTSRYSDAIDVEDVIQDALVKILKARKEGPVKAPKAYFFAVARNLAVDSLRSRRRVVPNAELGDEFLLEMMDDTEPVEETVARNHELEILTEAIQSLPERCRRAFTLSKVYGMTYQEIATEMEVSFNTVATQIATGLARCTRFMKHHGKD